MFVRVRKNSEYYRSMVYAVLGIGWYRQYIVLNPVNNEFELIPYLDKTVSPATPLVEIIQSDAADFSSYEGCALLKFKRQCRDSGIDTEHMDYMRGYSDVCENTEFLKEILLNGTVSSELYPIEHRAFSDCSMWKYILTQKDADEFMELFAGFHDSTLEKAYYCEDDGESSIRMTFDNSCWYGVAELCFEGLQAVKIVPAPENYSREIQDATLIVQDENVFWADGYMEQIDENYSGSYVKSLCLKWRKTEE